MPAHLTTIADAVVAALNGATFSEPHKAVFAERCYRPQAKLEEINGKVLCRIVPRSKAAAVLSRAATKEKEIQVDIGIQRKLDFSKNDDADAMELLCEEIENLFLGKALSTVARCIESEISPPYSLEHAEQMELYTTVIRLTFKLVAA